MTTHPHSVFQLARCRNDGVAASRAPYLLFLDGDCVLPPDHVAQHLLHKRSHQAMCGYCVRMDQQTTSRINETTIDSERYTQWVSQPQLQTIRKRDRKARFYQTIRHASKPRLCGGNFGLWRADFQRVNGFDENFEGWGGEDTDLGFRLRQAGVKIASILRWTYTYHLWHPPHATVPDRIRLGQNHAYLVRKTRLTKCIHGLVTRRSSDLVVKQVGTPLKRHQVAALLQCCPITLTDADHGRQSGQADIELLFMPGSGSFSGRANCNMLVVNQESRRARRLARKADIVVSDQPNLPVAADRLFRMAEFGQALNSIAEVR